MLCACVRTWCTALIHARARVEVMMCSTYYPLLHDSLLRLTHVQSAIWLRRAVLPRRVRVSRTRLGVCLHRVGAVQQWSVSSPPLFSTSELRTMSTASTLRPFAVCVQNFLCGLIVSWVCEGLWSRRSQIFFSTEEESE